MSRRATFIFALRTKWFGKQVCKASCPPAGAAVFLCTAAAQSLQGSAGIQWALRSGHIHLSELFLCHEGCWNLVGLEIQSRFMASVANHSLYSVRKETINIALNIIFFSFFGDLWSIMCLISCANSWQWGFRGNSQDMFTVIHQVLGRWTSEFSG